MAIETLDENRSTHKSDESLTVLNIGSGPRLSGKLHVGFGSPHWREIRLDIDPAVDPDIVSSATDLSAFAARSLNAIWSSHNIEHLHAHEVPVTFREFLRVLRPDGFALITCPDLAQVAQALIDQGGEFIAYQSPAGPITPIDMIFGHRRSIAAGNDFMTHRTGFTPDLIAGALLEAGFAEVRIVSGNFYDLWALALVRAGDLSLAQSCLEGTPQDGLLNDSPIAIVG